MPPQFSQWFYITTTGLNLATFLIAIKLIRHFSRLELKVELMWEVFERRFGPSISIVKERRAQRKINNG